MNCVKKALLSLAILALTAGAQASLLVEPHLGYAISKKLTYTTAGQSINAKGDGATEYGAKLGYQILGLNAGLDYTHSAYKLKLTVLGTTYTNDKTRDSLGVFVGYNLPILLRVWLGYDFSVKEKQDGTPSLGNSGDYMKGHATTLGVGFTPLPLLSLNFSYRMLTYTKSQAGDVNPELKPKEYVLGVSAPFTLF